MNDYGGLGILVEEKEPPLQLSLSSSSPTPASSPVPSDRIPSILDRPSLSDRHALHSSDMTTPSEQQEINDHEEVLLPPLPDEHHDQFTLQNTNSLSDIKSLSFAPESNPFDSLRATPNSSNNNSISNNNNNASNSISNSISNTSNTDSYHRHSLSNDTHTTTFFSNPSYSAYELDSPSLKLDPTDYSFFPSLHETSTNLTTNASTITTNTTNNPTPSTSANLTRDASSTSLSNITTNASSSGQSSPFKGLKSIKNGIRKLSLSKHSSNPSPSDTPSSFILSQPIPTRPMLSPLQTNDQRAQGLVTTQSSSASTIDSILSATTNNTTNNNTTNNTTNNNTATMTRVKLTRSRTNSNLTPTTPPITSPIITLSDNLSHSKKNLNQLEQSFFDTLFARQSTETDDASSSLISPTSLTSQPPTSSSTATISSTNDTTPRDRPLSISELNRPEELINYVNYLHQQKKSTLGAFEVTRQRLVDSGWCSEHDLNNLQLQQDSSLCQLDTKLIQVEHKLNLDFNISFLNNGNEGLKLRKLGGDKSTNCHRVMSIDQASPLSPSLKVIESRCQSFTQL